MLEQFTKIDGYTLENPDKVERVVFGNMGRGGVLEGGLGLEAAEKNPSLVLAHYDRLAGYITKDGIKIKTGSFWDFTRGVNKPRAKPEIMYIFNVGGEKIEVDDPKNLAQAVNTVQKAVKAKEEKVKEKIKKSKFKAQE